MGFLCIPSASRKLQRTVKNLRVSLLCLILTFLMLRNTIGAGKFGTPAQDFEEIKQRLHYVGLHRRVLAEAVEGGEADKHTKEASLSRRSPLESEAAMEISKTEQGNAALMVRQVIAPLLTSGSVKGGSLSGNAGLQKDLDGSRIDSVEHEDRRVKGALAQRSDGGSRVLLLTGLHSSDCKNPAGEHFLLKFVENKVQYSTMHGLEISLSLGGLDLHLSKLSLLQRSLGKYPHVEWLWWLPQDALITNMALQLPLQNYTEFNLVLLGSDGNAHHERQTRLINLNTDTFLIRNCQWSLDLLRASTEMEGDQGGRKLTNSLLIRPHIKARDQAALINVPDQEGKVYVERSVMLRGKWRYVAEKVERIVKQSKRGNGSKGLPFVTQYVGCTSCNRVLDKDGEMCVKQAERALAFVERQSMSIRAQESRSFNGKGWIGRRGGGGPLAHYQWSINH